MTFIILANSNCNICNVSIITISQKEVSHGKHFFLAQSAISICFCFIIYINLEWRTQADACRCCKLICFLGRSVFNQVLFSICFVSYLKYSWIRAWRLRKFRINSLIIVIYYLVHTVSFSFYWNLGGSAKAQVCLSVVDFYFHVIKNEIQRSQWIMVKTL